VPGAYELPFGAKCLLETRAARAVDAVLCVGCLIKGETMHFEYIAEAVTQVRHFGRFRPAACPVAAQAARPAPRGLWHLTHPRTRLSPQTLATLQGIMRLGLDSGVPVIFGVLTVLTEDQARARAGLPLLAQTGEAAPPHNHGVEWAQTALQMAQHRKTHLLHA
jgi:6,7-dimethyl-8-ribityllumazine synthase